MLDSIYINNIKEEIEDTEKGIISLALSDIEAIQDNMNEDEDYELTEEEASVFEEYKERTDITLDEANEIIESFNDERAYEEQSHLEKLQQKLRDAEYEFSKVEKAYAMISNTYKIYSVETSRKSESTYLSIDKDEYKRFVEDFGSSIDSDYYEDYTDENWKDEMTFTVRLATHDVGSKWNDDLGESVFYSDKHVFIDVNYI